MTNDDLIESLCNELHVKYGCHTAVLYGSRARGDWEATSDVDVIAFRDTGGPQRVASRWNGVFLDLFIHSTNDAADPGWIRINGGRVLFQRDGFGAQVLADIKALFDAGPDEVPVAELQVRRVWAEKMLERAGKADTEGNFRLHWLLSVLLEDYFAVRRQWYLGPKPSFSALSKANPTHYNVFDAALKPGASLDIVGKALEVAFEGV